MAVGAARFPTLDDDTIDRYLERIGVAERPHVDAASLAALMGAHLISVPFENLDVYDQRAVATDAAHSVEKIVERRRGGWCFEANGAFGVLLHSLGFDVRALGAAVLLGGPNDLIDHLTLEVAVDDLHLLVDVGFGESFITPLDLNRAGPQDGGNGTYEFMPSPKGTTLTRHVDGTPAAQFRFKRVTLDLDDFAPASDRLYGDPASFFRHERYATRLLATDGTRLTLTPERLKTEGPRGRDIAPVGLERADGFDALLQEHFGLRRGH